MEQGITSNVSSGSSVGIGGRTNAKLNASSSGTTRRQNPSCMSSFANRTGRSDGVFAMVAMIRGKTQPKFCIEVGGAVDLSVALLTGSTSESGGAYDRSNIILKHLLLCG